MQIIVEYESSWRNSFLDGSNNEPPPKGGREFVGSMRKLETDANYIERSVTKDTVMGILNRLIGDPRKLYQSRASQDYYFAEIEKAVTFQDKPSATSEEIIYLRNLNGNTDQNSFTGMIKATNPAFMSDYSAEFWGVLALTPEQLCDFILNDKPISDFDIKPIELDPIAILNRFTSIGKLKPVEDSGDFLAARQALSEVFEKYKPLNAKGKVLLSSMYCSALYLQLQRLQSRYDMESAKAKRGGISGISHNGVSGKDFMKAYTTGKGKLIYGNPYIKSVFVKGEGKTTNKLKKVSGVLVINLDIALETAQDLINKINTASVMTFYVGKKGLAWVSNITV